MEIATDFNILQSDEKRLNLFERYLSVATIGYLTPKP
jgi:hypothetical protein